MSPEKKTSRAMGQLLADDPSAMGTTIVGGQPPGQYRKKVTGVPVGIERVLYAAAVDPAFKARLLEDREAAIKARGFKLRDSELAMLRLTPVAQLESTIDGLDTSNHSLERRAFMRAVAASIVTLAAADTLSACGEDTVKGIRPDTTSGFDSGGIRPDFDSLDASAGVRPDGSSLDVAAGVRLDGNSYDVTAPGRPDSEAVGEDMTIEIDQGEVDRGIRPDGGD